MQVSMAVMPPEDVIDEIAAIMASVPRARDQVDLVHSGALRIPVIGLGNLTRPDVQSLCEHLEDAVAGLGRTPKIGLAGAKALESPDDPTIAFKISGDLDGLTVIGKSLPQMVSDFGFYVDRRQFIPQFTIGRITPATTLPVLQQLVDIMDAYRSREWEVVGVDVISRVHRDDGAVFEKVRVLYTG